MHPAVNSDRVGFGTGGRGEVKVASQRWFRLYRVDTFGPGQGFVPCEISIFACASGASLALRLPAPVAREAGLELDQRVRLEVEHDCVVNQPPAMSCAINPNPSTGVPEAPARTRWAMSMGPCSSKPVVDLLMRSLISRHSACLSASVARRRRAGCSKDYIKRRQRSPRTPRGKPRGSFGADHWLRCARLK